MGMAASQVRLLQLTSRKHDIGRELSSLSLQKTALSNDSKKVTLKYQQALNTKSLKWTNNSGVSYVDLSYKNLMYPNNVANSNTPYLLTDRYGKTLVDSKYVDYAEMISPNGEAGGDWAGNRTKILSQLTGISEEKIENSNSASANLATSDEKVNQLQGDVDKLKSKCTKKATTNNFLANCFGSIKGFSSLGVNNVASDYKKTSDSNIISWSLGNGITNAKASLKELMTQIKANVKDHLFDADYEKFEAACDSAYETYASKLTAADTTTGVGVTKDSKNNFSVEAQAIIDEILKQYTDDTMTVWSPNSCDSSIVEFHYVDKSSTDYQNYLTKLAELEAAKSENKQMIDTNNQALTAAEENQIAFYDQLFTSIADNGWTYDIQIDDTEYLNLMLQNNQYYITTMSQETNSSGDDYYEYNSSIASNFDYIVSVNDSKVQAEAQAEYEYEKTIINEKESRIDTRMQNLETEQESINQMIKGIESVRDDNGERNFSIFS